MPPFYLTENCVSWAIKASGRMRVRFYSVSGTEDGAAGSCWPYLFRYFSGDRP